MEAHMDVLTGVVTLVESSTGGIDEPVKTVASQRVLAKSTRAEFCNTLYELELVPFDEALAAAKGDWPKTFAAALDGLPVFIQEQIQITWAAVQEIERMNWLFLALQSLLGWSDAKADALFGIK